jgi:hypothetical protein
VHAALGNSRKERIVLVERPKSLKDLEALRYEMKNMSLEFGCLFIVLVIASVVLGAIISAWVPTERIWPWLRSYWLPESLIVAFMALLLPWLIIFHPEARRNRANQSLYEAVRGFDAAELEFAKWKEEGDNRQLRKSYEDISKGIIYLRDVPEYAVLLKEIEAAYKD